MFDLLHDTAATFVSIAFDSCNEVSTRNTSAPGPLHMQFVFQAFNPMPQTCNCSEQ